MRVTIGNMLVFVTVSLSACSERVSDELGFQTQVRLACEASCKVTATCDPSNPHYGSMPSCRDGCAGWGPLEKPSECADAILGYKYCFADLTCEEFLTHQHGEIQEASAICQEEFDQYHAACSKRK